MTTEKHSIEQLSMLHHQIGLMDDKSNRDSYRLDGNFLGSVEPTITKDNNLAVSHQYEHLMARNARNQDLEFQEHRLAKERQVNIQNLDNGENAYS